jgi:hypothetical protein
MTAQVTHSVTHSRTQARTTESATAADRGRLRDACHRIHLVIQEMNYASRRVVERQAPWTVDPNWYRR